jgi:hypothetical protein
MFAAACATSDSVVCEDGSTCPGGFQCDPVHDRCLLPEQVFECSDKADGDECTFNGAPGACQFGACVTFYCGDGRITGREQCEPTDIGVDNNGDPATCITVGYYAPVGLACNPTTCLYDTTACTGGYCGDTEVNGPELCDGPTTQTCVAIGFDAGSVTCNAQCGFQIRDCNRFGWNPESISDVSALAVAGSGPDDQWALGSGGKAMHYEGAFWNTWPTGVTNPLVGGWSVAPDDTWAVGQGVDSNNPSVVIHWSGKTTGWSKVTSIPIGEYVDVWAADANNVYIGTEANGVLHWNGATWSVLGNLSDEVVRIHGVAPDNIFVATKAGPLAHWDGTAWTTITDATIANIQFHFLDANGPHDVWAAGNLASDLGAAAVAHYNGTTWTTWTFPQQALNGIAASAPNDAWLAGVDGIMRHWDGDAWSSSTNVGSSPSGLAAISGFISLSGTEVLGVSTQYLAYRFRGQAFGLYKPLGPDPFTAAQNTAMWGTTASDQYVTNVRGEIWHYDGTAWTNVYTIAGGPITANAIHGVDANTVYVGAANGHVYHWNGAIWADEAAATSSITKVFVVAAGDVWAFTDSQVLHRESNGTWTAYLLGSTRPLSVSGTSGSDIWVVTHGPPAKLFHWDGSAWSEAMTDASDSLLAVLALSPSDVHVTAMHGRMEHYNGVTWSEQVVTPLADLTMLAGTGKDDVIAASERDLFHYDGNEWAEVRPPVDFVPNTADYLPIVAVQVTPGRIDMMLQRYRIRTLLRTRALKCELHEVCGDSVDNDCDGDIDSSDAECAPP